MPRSAHLIPVCLLVLAGGMSVAQAEDPPAWTTYLEGQRARTEPRGTWTLVTTGPAFSASTWRRDDVLMRLIATGTFRIQSLPEPVTQALATSRAWPANPTWWCLVSPDAAKREEGLGLPTPALVLERLKGLGFKPRWEVRDAFLREHPRQGAAQEEALQEGLRLAALRIQALQEQGRLPAPPDRQPPGGGGRPGWGGGAPFFGRLAKADPFQALDPAQAAPLADSVFQEAATALAGLLAVPGWEEERSLMSLILAFRLQGAGVAPRMQNLATQALDQLSQAVRQRPHEEAPWGMLGALSAVMGRDLRAVLDQVIPVPGRPWPPQAALQAVIEHHAAQNDWEALLAFVGKVQTEPPSQLGDDDAWEAWCQRRARLEVARAQALGRLGRMSDLTRSIEEVRRWAGDAWKGDLRRRIRQSLPELRSEALKATFDPILDSDPLPLPTPPPGPPRLRLVLLDAPADTWQRLRSAPALAAWGPQELRWENLARPAAQALAREQGWAPGTTWALFDGPRPLATGQDQPMPAPLAARLTDLRPSALSRLEQILSRQPDHLDAQEAQATLLAARMPNPALEPLLAASCQAAGIAPPEASGWKPNPDLWGGLAGSVLRRLQEELEAWPDREAAWRGWLAWSRLAPSSPGPLAMAKSLPIWGSTRRWTADLPGEVHLAVAAELRTSGRFQAMKAWFEEAWEALDTRPLRGPARPWMRDMAKEEERTVVAPYLEVLAVLGLNQRHQEVRETWQAHMASFEAPRPARPAGPGNRPQGGARTP